MLPTYIDAVPRYQVEVRAWPIVLAGGFARAYGNLDGSLVKQRRG